MFCPETYHTENTSMHGCLPIIWVSREDPATGSATGVLPGILLHHRYFEDMPVDIRVEQDTR